MAHSRATRSADLEGCEFIQRTRCHRDGLSIFGQEALHVVIHKGRGNQGQEHLCRMSRLWAFFARFFLGHRRNQERLKLCFRRGPSQAHIRLPIALKVSLILL